MARRKHIGLLHSALLVGLLAATGWLARCTPREGEDAGIDPELQRRVLESVASRAMVPAHARFLGATVELERATSGYASSGSEADRASARQAWRDAMNAWQRIEPMRVGPLLAEGEGPGGMGLRDEIYSWPVTNRCRIDQETVAGGYADVDAFAARLVNVRGLDAMEYLLFAPTLENECSALSPINADGTWAALGDAEIEARRAAYATTLARLVRRSAEALVAAWAPEGGDFVSQLAQAGAGATAYRSAGEALNAVTDALFYIDLVTKDRKVAAPAGLRDCTTPVCPELVESRLAAVSNENIASNLRGLEQVLLGGDPDATDAYGFDDLLAALGEAELATRMRANITAAIASAALDAPLAEAVQSTHADVLALHEAIKRITDDLKGPFLASLSLRIPAEGAGDAD